MIYLYINFKNIIKENTIKMENKIKDMSMGNKLPWGIINSTVITIALPIAAEIVII